MDEILTFNLTAMLFGALALVVGYLSALPKVEISAAPFAMFIELGPNK